MRLLHVTPNVALPHANRQFIYINAHPFPIMQDKHAWLRSLYQGWCVHQTASTQQITHLVPLHTTPNLTRSVPPRAA